MKKLFVLATVVAASLLMSARAGAQAAPPLHLPYAVVHDPQFTSASEATFLHADDRVIGVMIGKVAKAYPAGILSQHGMVEDQSPDGPIAVTW